MRARGGRAAAPARGRLGAAAPARGRLGAAAPARGRLGAAALAAAGVTAGLAAWAGWIEPRRLAVRHVELHLPAWPDRLDGLRAGAVSDIHAGVPHMGLARIARAVDALNDRAPDVHFILGDVLDASQPWRRRLAPEVIARELARLHAPLGTIAVIGNHDWRNSGDRMWRALEQVGITVLEDRAVELADGLWVAGLGDMRNRRPSVARALGQVPAGAAVLMLSHDPDMFPEVPVRVALTLAGHTHGGQVAIPLLRRPMLPSHYGERYARGHVVEHGRHLFVSSGLGTSGLPIRFLAPPEVLDITLRAEGKV